MMTVKFQKKGWIAVCLLVMILGGGVFVSHAQTDDAALIDYVGEAWQNMKALETYRMEGTSTNQSVFSDWVTDSISELDWQLRTDAHGEMVELMGTIDVSSFQNGEATTQLSFELRQTQGLYYIRYSSFEMDGLDELFPPVDGEWYFYEAPTTSAPITNSSNQVSNGLLMSFQERGIDPEAVIAIRELPSESLDGVEMRVIELEIDYAAYYQTELGTQALIEYAEKVAMTQRLWIGLADQLVHRNKTIMHYQDPSAADGEVDETLSTLDIRLTAFDVPFSLEIPSGAVPYNSDE